MKKVDSTNSKNAQMMIKFIHLNKVMVFSNGIILKSPQLPFQIIGEPKRKLDFLLIILYFVIVKFILYLSIIDREIDKNCSPGNFQERSVLISDDFDEKI